MVKMNMRGIQNCGEVAPALIRTPKKCSSKFPRLEPIIEEGPESFQIMPKRMLFLVPTFISCVSYFLLYRYVNGLIKLS
ncbi:transmembrane protein, putative [Medicago truncatula]|uniref:Transmembrane protein, putative n=1 Tax=Medicago truncatula TaxID=3880 RepID=G7KG05_MEDTR|nr:transmembrane protein, putative [Medicago truncatula]